MLKVILFLSIFPTIFASYWKVGRRGFLPVLKQRHCTNEKLQDFCKILKTNSTTEDIERAASKIDINDIFAKYGEETIDIYDESVIEDTFHMFSVATCRIGYNQNPTGGKIDTPITIPPYVSKILLTLAEVLNREPTTGYASLVLDNCVQTFEDGKFKDSYEDWLIQRTVTTTDDDLAHRAEKGFYAAHCSVEYMLGNSITNLMAIAFIINFDEIIKNITEDNSHTYGFLFNGDAYSNHIIMDKLREFSSNTRKAIGSLKQMRHYFNPEHFFGNLRPYLKCGNIGENDIIFEGNEDSFDEYNPLKFQINLPNRTIREIELNKVINGFRGPTGAQTSSLLAIDAALQITTSINSDENLKTTMQEFSQYQPVEHYELIEKFSTVNLRDYVKKTSNNELIDAYNDAVTAVAEFRFAHMDHVQTYIFKSVPQAPKHKITGTGNTPLAAYLCKSALGTLNSIIKEGSSNNLPQISIPLICIQECIKNNEYLVHTKEYCAEINDYINN